MATRELRCVVVTPEGATLDVAADFVALPLYDGEIGILPGRAPFVGRLGYGELRVKRGTQTTERLYVDGGFVQMRADVVSVLTTRAISAKEVKPAEARQALDAALQAQRKASSTEAQEAALAAQNKARAQLRVAGHAGNA